MSIETIGSMKGLLEKHDGAKWLRAADIEGNRGDVSLSDGAFEDSSSVAVSGTKKSFGEMLTESMVKVNDLQKDADVAMQRLASGQSKNLHETLLAVERAEIAFKTMNQVRLKVIEAYREIMRMQL